MANGPYWDEGLMVGRGDFPNIVAIGDSWFWYPRNNLLIPMWNLWAGNKVIFAQGKNGAEAEELADGKYLKNFGRILKGYPSIQAVLISAGGNDFAGEDDMSTILAPMTQCAAATEGSECFNADELYDLMWGTVRGAYRTLINEVATHRGEAFIFLHNYDYALPDGRGFIGFGKWLQYPLTQAGVRMEVQRKAVNYLLDYFNDVLAQISLEFAERTILIDTSGELSDSDWANELHPRPAGFNRLVNTCWAPRLMEVVN
jgi:hypothetical protein